MPQNPRRADARKYVHIRSLFTISTQGCRRSEFVSESYDVVQNIAGELRIRPLVLATIHSQAGTHNN